MGKPLLFYLIDEHTDDIKYCEQKGMVPCKFADKELDGKRYIFWGDMVAKSILGQW